MNEQADGSRRTAGRPDVCAAQGVAPVAVVEVLRYVAPCTPADQ
ncbi:MULTISPECIES: hypothetical protein [unclassified Pseudonocardia]|nr:MULTISPECIES: hypothetical protein [unclassified Pseudonocardia]